MLRTALTLLQAFALTFYIVAPMSVLAADPTPDPSASPSQSADPSADPTPDPSTSPSQSADPTASAAPSTAPDPTATPDPTPAPSAPAPSDPPAASEPPASGATISFIVTFAPDGNSEAEAELLASVGAVAGATVPALHMQVVELAEATFLADLDVLRASPLVASVDLDRTRAAEAAPNDTAYSIQWALPQIGWDQLYGNVWPSGTATVAILDTGIDGSHPDLDQVLMAGTSILDGSDGLTDPNGHGTAMAGIVGAETNNSWGMAGVAFGGVSLMPVTVLDASGQGQDSDIIAGVVYAADHGADVILMAFSNPGFSPALQAALDYAWAHGAVLVAATGNDASSSVTYPAGDRGVIGVAATDQTDALASFSNYGADTFLVAPGVDIQASAPGGGRTTISGTSAAAAHVAGAAALLAALDPSASNGVLVDRLASNADPAGDPAQTGNGRLNLARAASDTSTDSIEPDGAAPVGGGGPLVGPYLAATKKVQSVSVGAQSGTATFGTASTVTYSIPLTYNGSGACAAAGSFGVSGLPAGATGVFSPSSVTTCPLTTTLTVTTTASNPAGSTTFTVTADGKSDTGTLTINEANTTTTITSDLPDPSVVGQAYIVNFTVTSGAGTPTGNVTVSDGSATCVGTVAAGTCNLTSTTAGAKTLTATYAGGTNFATSTSAGVSHTVNAATTTTTITSDLPDPTVVGQSYTVNYSVTVNSPGSGTPTGNVTVSDGSASCVGTVAAGTCNLTSTSVGSKTLTATYAGNANFTTSTSAGVSHTVNAANTTTTITSDSPDPSVAGSPYTVNWTVVAQSPGSGTPTGTVTISDGTDSCGPITLPTATCSFTSTTTGSKTLTATYISDSANFNSSSATASHTVTGATANVTLEGWKTLASGHWSTMTMNNGDQNYVEGQSVPFRLGLNGIAKGAAWSITIQYDFADGTDRFFDSLSSFDRTEPAVGCAGHVCGAPTTFAIPSDGTLPAGAQVSGMFTVYNGTMTATSSYTTAVVGGTTVKRLTISGVAASGSGTTDVLILYGGHLARENEWGPNNGATSFPGASGKMYYTDFSGGGSDGQISVNIDAGDKQSDLSITKTDSPDPVAPGGSLTYTITVTNNGPNLETGAVVSDIFPAQVTGVTWSCVVAPIATGSCTPAIGAGAIASTVNLNAGSSATFTATGTASASVPGAISNTASVTSGTPADPNMLNNTANETTDRKPTASGQSVTTPEDTAKLITLAGSDLDGDSLTFGTDVGPLHGTLSVLGAPSCSGGSPNNCTATVTYTPALDYNGADSFTFHVNDGAADSSTATVSITVTEVNDAPVATDDTVTAIEDTTLNTTTASLLVNDTDVDGPSLAITAVSGATGGAATLMNNGTAGDPSDDFVRFVPTANLCGTGAGGYDYTVSDGALSDTGHVFVNITCVNDEPSFSKGADQTVNEDAGPQTVFPWATAISAGPADESGQALTFHASNDNNALFSSQPSVAADGTLSYTPAANANGSATVTLYLTDDGGTLYGGDDTSPNQTFSITVRAVNDEPSFSKGADQTVNED
ncbi:MAG: S8 family serine peptidase, partial [Chloroflexota bacterium]